jgi:hypothetical protein
MNRPPGPARISVPEDVLFQPVADEAVLLDVASGRYFGLNASGMRMWQALADCGSLEAACARLLLEFEVEEETLRRDLEELVEQLRQRGLVKVDE